MTAACAHGDNGLAALALYEAVAENSTEPAALISGLVSLVHALALSLAAQSGSDVASVVESLRALLLTYPDSAA